MWFKIKSFIHFLINSTNQHGVHSPFVYDLVTQCFYSKTEKSKSDNFTNIQNSLYNNHKKITVTDFGSGSKVFKDNNRRISDIAKVAGISKKRALLLIRLIEYFNPQNILEIGTSVGLATSALSIGNPKATIYTLEGCKNTATIASKTFQKFNFSKIKTVIGNFEETLPKTINNKQFDLIYFDGNHKKEATLNYFNRCVSATRTNSIFIFDDINWSGEMQEAWEIIKQHPNVTVTINTYFWGIVFFRTELLKQHFTIRI